jgi:hypothetical protein
VNGLSQEPLSRRFLAREGNSNDNIKMRNLYRQKETTGLAHLELPNQGSLLLGSHWNAGSLNNQIFAPEHLKMSRYIRGIAASDAQCRQSSHVCTCSDASK